MFVSGTEQLKMEHLISNYRPLFLFSLLVQSLTSNLSQRGEENNFLKKRLPVSGLSV